MRVIARMNVGGPAVQVAGLMRNLDHERFDQRLYTGWCAPDEADYLLTQAPDVPVNRVDGLGRAVRPGEDLLVVRRLHRAIREFHPDIIHTHTAKAGAIGRSAALLANTDALLVHTFHGHLLHGYFSPAKTKAVIALESFLARRTTTLVAVGPQVREDLLAVGIGRREQFEIIPPGLEFPDPPPKAEARAALDIDPEATVISLIGRLTTIKRADRFADAVELLMRRLPQVSMRFLVAGDGDTASTLADTIVKRDLPITMLGWRSDIPAILAATDILVLTSDNEGTPISLIQAAMAGLPVVATNVGSVKDVVVDQTTGLLTACTAQAIADAMQELVEDRPTRNQMGSAAFELAQGKYTVKRLAADHSRLYETLLDMNGSS
ncbi:MAG: glycosyltransferase [Actinomycetota bacterium]|nr:glycosyltransferase [Actinomycetota bacterium]